MPLRSQDRMLVVRLAGAETQSRVMLAVTPRIAWSEWTQKFALPVSAR